MNSKTELTITEQTLNTWIKSCQSYEQLNLFPSIIKTFIEQRFADKIPLCDLHLEKSRLLHTVFLKRMELSDKHLQTCKIIPDAIKPKVLMNLFSN